MHPDPEFETARHANPNDEADQDDAPRFGRLLLVLVAAVLFVVGLTVFTVAYHS